MVKNRIFISSLLNNVVIIALLVAISLQTAGETLSIFSETTFDVVQIDAEDTNEEISESENSIDEEPEIQSYHFDTAYLLSKPLNLNRTALNLLIPKIALEILIPPPDFN